MSDLPPGIRLPRHRDLDGRVGGQWAKRAVLTILSIFAIAALANAFGQEPTSNQATTSSASLEVTAPERLRGGLIYQATFRIHAFRKVEKPTLVLERGWLNETTLNTTSPEPTSETADARHVYIEFEPLEPGSTLPVQLSFQANPTNFGSHSNDVAFDDGREQLVSVDRSQLNLP